MQHAVLAAEDRGFYDEGGVLARRASAARSGTTCTGGSLQGGSTITQQYAKNAFLTQERTFSRKIQELVLAVKLDTSVSQGPDPRRLPQHHLLRSRRLRHRVGGDSSTSADRSASSTSGRRPRSPRSSARPAATRRTPTSAGSRAAGTTSSTAWCSRAGSPPAQRGRGDVPDVHAAQAGEQVRRHERLPARRGPPGAAAARLHRGRHQPRRPAGDLDVRPATRRTRPSRRSRTRARRQGSQGPAHRPRRGEAGHRRGRRDVRRRRLPHQPGEQRHPGARPGRLDVQAVRPRRGASSRA